MERFNTWFAGRTELQQRVIFGVYCVLITAVGIGTAAGAYAINHAIIPGYPAIPFTAQLLSSLFWSALFYGPWGLVLLIRHLYARVRQRQAAGSAEVLEQSSDPLPYPEYLVLQGEEYQRWEFPGGRCLMNFGPWPSSGYTVTYREGQPGLDGPDLVGAELVAQLDRMAAQAPTIPPPAYPKGPIPYWAKAS